LYAKVLACFREIKLEGVKPDSSALERIMEAADAMTAGLPAQPEGIPADNEMAGATDLVEISSEPPKNTPHAAKEPRMHSNTRSRPQKFPTIPPLEHRIHPNMAPGAPWQRQPQAPDDIYIYIILGNTG